MQTGLADLLHDAAVLHGFVDFIEEYCREQERSQTYSDASGLFFQYVEELAAGIKEELGNEINRATRFPSRLPVLRRNILTLKYYLRLLHALIKPAADAHTLTIPAPLIDLASQQLQRVEGMRKSKIVILLTPEFMYFQRPHTHVKEQARLVQTVIPQATFPARLGFIELPYSQGPSFFTNLAIYHEIGHFVYEELSNSDPAHPGIVALRSVTNRSLSKAFGSRQVFAVAVKIIENWTQEIFCDLFAIRLVGPQSLVDAFLDSVVPAIRKLIRQITIEPTRAVKRFEQDRSSIEDCLKVGVVPHTNTLRPPDPVSIINAAFCFYLTSLPDVIKQFEGPEAENDVRTHSLWTKRLEMWTMKAIEDSQIQERFRTLKGTALWSFLEKKS